MVPVDDNPVTLQTSFTGRIERADKCKKQKAARDWGGPSNINTSLVEPGSRVKLEHRYL